LGGAGGRADLRRDAGQWRHHGDLARWPPRRAPPDARPDDHQHLLWRPGHEDRVHHAVLDRAARRGRLADSRPQAQLGGIAFQLLAPPRPRWVALYERTAFPVQSPGAVLNDQADRLVSRASTPRGSSASGREAWPY